MLNSCRTKDHQVGSAILTHATESYRKSARSTVQTWQPSKDSTGNCQLQPAIQWWTKASFWALVQSNNYILAFGGSAAPFARVLSCCRPFILSPTGWSCGRVCCIFCPFFIAASQHFSQFIERKRKNDISRLVLFFVLVLPSACVCHVFACGRADSD